MTIPGLSNVKQLSAGDDHCLALMNDGTVKAWGGNFWGELGTGDYCILTPETVSGLSSVTKLSTNEDHSLALINDGTVKSWGFIANSSIPTTVPGLANVLQLSAGDRYSLVVINDGTIKSWGNNTFGQLGIGNNTDQSSPITIPDLIYDTISPMIEIAAPSSWGTTNTVTTNISDAQSDIAIQKWAIGKNLPVSFFENNGTMFTGNSFTVSQNGDYTVYAKDNIGNETTQNVKVDHVLPSSTIGSYSKSFTNMKVNSPGMDMNLGLNYNSNDTTTGPFGKGWTFSYSGSVKDYEYKYSTTTQNGNDQTATLSGLKVVKLPDGSTYNYLLNDDNVYTTYNTTDKLTQNSDGTYSLVTSDKITYTFNTNGYLSSITDRDGNTIRIDVDPNGKVNSVTDTAGRVYTLSDSTNAITLTDPINRVVTYNLQNGNLTTITDPMGVTINQFDYDASGFLSNIKDGLNNTVASISYDHVNKDKILSITDENNNIVNYTYNDSDNSVKSTNVSNSQSTITWYNSTNLISKLQDTSGNKIFYIYDASGNEIKQIVPKNGTGEYIAGSDQSLFDITSYQYDGNNNILYISYPNGTSEAYTYDDNKNVLTQDKGGTKTYYEYDGNGNVTLMAVRKSGTDDYSDNLTTEQKQNFNITQYTHYNNGMVNIETDPDGSSFTNTYNSNGDILSINSSKDGVTTYTYNDIGWVTSVEDPNNNITSYVYDNDKRILRETNNGKVTRILYDSDGRVIQMIGPDQYDSTKDGLNNITPTNTYSDSNIGVRYTYDNKGNVLTKSDSKNNNTIIYLYDSNNKVIKTTLNDTFITRYIYDSQGNLIQKIYPNQYDPAKDGLNNETPVNTYSDSNVGDRFTYDTNGNVLTHIDLKNNTTSNTYNSDNFVIKSVYNNTNITRYIYDSNGKLIQQVNPDQYDPNKDGLNNLQPTNTYSDLNVGDRYTYDSSGNMLTHIGSNNKTTSYTYDSNNTITTLTQSDGSVFTYNSEGCIVTDLYPNGKTYTSQYNNDGTISSITGNNDFSTQLGYDSNHNVNQFTQTFGSNTKSLSYTYDSQGNIITISDSGVQKVKYYYDTNSELTREDNVWQNQTITYSYDQIGNMLNKKVYPFTSGDLGTVIATYSNQYNNQNQLTNYNGNNITYDTNGNIKTFNGWTYSWENTDQLSGMSNTGNTISYQYNYDGYRTSKTVNGVTTTYALNGSMITSQTDGTNTICYTYDSNRMLIYMTLNGTVYYYEKNNQGDIIGLVDSSGNEVVTYSYDSWGKLLTLGGTLASTVGTLNPFRYRGYYYDNETGMYYLQSRYYNPVIGQFISKDDASYTYDTSCVGENLYAYCGNNPINRYDDNGMCWIRIISWAIRVDNAIVRDIGIDTAAIGAFFLDMQKATDDSDNIVYRANFDCWQQYFGYNDLYDYVFNLGTSMKAAKFDFSYNGNPYTIWAWKGDYVNLGAGAELGIYRGDSWQRTVDTSLAMWMCMSLFYKNKCIIDYSPYENQWWITGFNPKYQNVSASDLTAFISVYFDNLGMYDAFKKIWGGDPRLTFNDLYGGGQAILEF